MSVRIRNYLSAAMAILLAPAIGCAARQLDFTHVVIDEQIGGRTAIVDIDGDGDNDIAVHTWSTNRGVENDGKIGWYEYPTRERHSILDQGHIFGDGILIVDLDADGDNDIVSAQSWDKAPVQLWRNTIKD